MRRYALLVLTGLLLLPCAIRAQTHITHQQALQAVRDFWGDQNLGGAVDGPTDEGQTGGVAVGYNVEVTGSSKAGSYRVLATNGAVLLFGVDHSAGATP